MQTNLGKMIQFAIFAIIQLPLLPLAIIGYIFSVVKALLYTKKHGISGTATNAPVTRWILHIFGLREDEEGTKLIYITLYVRSWIMVDDGTCIYC